MRDDLHRETGSSSPPTDQNLNFAGRKGDRIGPQGIAGLGILGFFLAWFISSRFPYLPIGQEILIFLITSAAPMALASLFLNRVHLRPGTGLKSQADRFNAARCGVKLLGLAGTFFGLSLIYWLFPEYQRDFYAPVWSLATAVFWPALPFVVAYFIWVDQRMTQPHDGYWYFGLLLLGRSRAVDWGELREYLLGWIIKGFFLPFMIAALGEHLVVFLQHGWNLSNFAALFGTSFALTFTIDTVFGVIGYLLTLRLLDASIRSVEPTWLGWISALMCYIPFSLFVAHSFLNYKGKSNWSEWLGNYPLILLTWGFIILLLQVVYVWSSISFGYRFSNLTDRGIIVNGPYRFVKHPAYLAKNLGWWLISVPFVAHGNIQDNLRGCVLLGLMNSVYFVRAKTEERHLMADPAYRLYTQWIAQYGLVAILRRACEFWYSELRRILQRNASESSQ